MVDKKTAAIAVLCVATVLCLGLLLNSAQEINRLEGELWELEGNYEKLASVRTSLEENYSELRTEKEDLEEEYSNLEADVTSLEKSYLALQAESRDLILAMQETNSLLMSNYSTLRGDYLTLYSRYNSLKEDYDALLQNQGPTITINLKIDYGGGNVIWHNATRVPLDANLLTATRLLVDVDYTTSDFGAFVNEIDGVGGDANAYWRARWLVPKFMKGNIVRAG